MLMRGTTKHTREQLRDEFDRLKASVSVGGDSASIETLRPNLPAVLRLVAEVLREPAFPES
jgi:zinc protease